MSFLKECLALYRQWRLVKPIAEIKNAISDPIDPSIIINMLDAIYPPNLAKYATKDGFHVWLTVGSASVSVVLSTLEAAAKAMQADDLPSINKLLIRQSTRELLLIDFLVDANQYTYSISDVEGLLRTRITNIQAIILAADSEQQTYYLRKLTNILRESFVVTEALMKAADLTWRINPIKKLLRC